MANREDKKKIKSIIKIFFNKENSIRLYFIKNSRETNKYQKFIAFKTRKKTTQEHIKKVERDINFELRNENWKLIAWKDIVEFIPESKIYKIPFYDSNNIELQNPWRSCPMGEHWVRRHSKNMKSGVITDHDGHCRKNPSGKDIIKGDEIELIANQDLFLNPIIKVSSNNLGFNIVGNTYDKLISGWTAYWNNIFKLSNPLHPNFVKALIATESSFLPKSKAKNKSNKIGTAKGLIQLTDQSYKILKNQKGELKDYFVELEEDELWDPNKNIAASVRWLFRKRETTKAILKREPTWEEVLWDYKGILKSKTNYAKDVKTDLKKYLGKME